jgi:Na+/H+ antiporter NhaD/arsenite permease-like protein
MMIFLLCFLFIAGYLAIVFEHKIKINKSSIALITAILSWVIIIFFQEDKSSVNHLLSEHLSEIASILFFLLGAMTIVELIDAHDGFAIITDKINTTNPVKLLWVLSFITFFMSSILDNLTTAIVMVSLLRNLIKDEKTRLLFAGMIVIASNAGGAWSPIGDVTTTMLWIGNQITPLGIMKSMFLPSLFCLLLPLIILSFKLNTTIEKPNCDKMPSNTTTNEQILLLFLGLLILVLVPVFKIYTHLPPYMGMLLGVGIIWFITECIHFNKKIEDKSALSVQYALRKIDTPSILFFLGILLSIAALQSGGILDEVTTKLTYLFKTKEQLAISLGVLSAIVDNVPLMAATQAMYSLDTYPTDNSFWHLLAYTTGTGGSCLIIGSAAGVVAMGIEKIDFGWYLKHITWLALIGYIAGILIFLV